MHAKKPVETMSSHMIKKPNLMFKKMECASFKYIYM